MGKFSDRLSSSRARNVPGKISERLMNFAGPLLPDTSALKPEDVETHTRSAVMIAVAIWNAHIFEAIGSAELANRTRALADTSAGTARGNIVEELWKRKDQHFADDLRLIEDFNIFRNKAGELRVNLNYRTAKPGGEDGAGGDAVISTGPEAGGEADGETLVGATTSSSGEASGAGGDETIT